MSRSHRTHAFDRRVAPRIAASAWLASLALLACADSDEPNRGDAEAAHAEGGTGLPFGAPCTRSEQCEYEACVEVGDGRAVCSGGCTDERNCPAARNWACVDDPETDLRVCACRSDATVEICGDGIDNDCDAVVDCASDGGAADAAVTPDGGAASCADDPGLCPLCRTDAECDDGIACTADHCWARGCVHVPDDTRCTGAEVCDPRMNGCRPARPCAGDNDCADDDACTQGEYCDMVHAACRFTWFDGDGDQRLPLSCGGDDCDDANPRAYPGALDVCDGVDNDCNGSIDPPSRALLCAEGRMCVGGYCACPDGLIDCDGRCVGADAFQNDDRHCGQCRRVCPSGRRCELGECADIDECAQDPNPCPEEATCVNSPGAFYCDCPDGYEHRGDGCTDVNECTYDEDGCDDRPDACHNTEGGFECACPSGYTGDGVGKEGCIDIDECAMDGGDCAVGTLCVNQPGSFGCTLRALAVTASENHSCAIREDGRVKCWGVNAEGQLGLGAPEIFGDHPGEMGDDLPALDLGTGRTALAIAAGVSHTCALLDDHSVKCWGSAAHGQLGIGDVQTRGDEPDELGDALPAVNLGTGRTAVAITAGAFHTCALLDDDSVKCWGDNAYAQLGLGDPHNRGYVPSDMGDALPAVDLGSGRTAVAIAAGAFHTCALLDNGSVKCWGDNASGQLGLGDTLARGYVPTEMGNALLAVDLGEGRTATAIATRGFHTCAVLDDQTIKCWGNNEHGQLGLGDTNHRGDEPNEMGDALPALALGTGRHALAVAAGVFFTCARLDDDSVKCWGSNDYGQLGQGDIDPRGDDPGEMGDALPALDFGPGRSAAVLACGALHACALLDDGTLKCWGANDNGALGVGDTLPHGDEPGELAATPAVDLGSAP